MTSLTEIFTEKVKNKHAEKYGFSKKAKLLQDKEHIIVLGSLEDYSQPNNYVEIIIGKEESMGGKKRVMYVRKNSPNLDSDLTAGLIMAKDKDDLIRSLVKDTRTYTSELVYTESDYKKGKFYSELITYVGKERVILGTPLIVFDDL